MVNLLVFILMIPSQYFEICKCLKELSDKQWRVRENATVKLIKMDEKAFPYIKNYLKVTECPESFDRCERMIHIFYESIKPTTYKAIPWIDALPKQYPNRDIIISKYMEGMDRSGICGDKLFEYMGYRLATKNYIIDLHKSGIKKKDIIKLLDSMVPEELEQLKNMYGHNYYNYKFY